MKQFELVIVGGGLASARAIKSYREAGGSGAIALLSEDAVVPYHRPPLSKRYLRGETGEAPLVEDEAFYREHDVELLLQTSVTALDPGERSISVADGARYRYEKLLIASGARPNRLDVPGAALDGVFSLRTLADSQAIRDAATQAQRAVVVGAGFIGMEVAASLRRLDVDVTLIHAGRGLFERLGSEQLSAELVSLYRDNGVELLLGESVASFDGGRRLGQVTTGSGVRIDADLAVAGVGVAPAVDFLAGSGLVLDNGIAVNERFETSVPGVHAVGDVANFFDPLYGRRRRIEHWSNANYQGGEVGKLLASADGGYDAVSSFFTEVFGVTLKVFGDVSRFDELTAGGSLAGRDLLATYGHGGRLVGALAVGLSDDVERRLEELIRSRAAASTVPAPDPDTARESLVGKTEPTTQD